MWLKIKEYIEDTEDISEYPQFKVSEIYGENLKALRKSVKLSQSELAKGIEISRGQIANYETQASEPSIKTIKKIADYFNKTIDDFIYREYRKEFYMDWALIQRKYYFEFEQSLKHHIKLKGKAGLIEFDNNKITNFDQGIINFLLLEEIEENLLTKYCKDNINESNAEFAGYPLLMNLYIALNKTFWIGKADIWPTSGNNILALQFLDGRIVQLHISGLQSGCNLTCSYSEEVERQIKLWMKLNKNDAEYIVRKYFFQLFKEEENYWDE